MGFKTSWAASQDIPLPELERRMKLRRTGEVFTEFDLGFCSATLENGWNFVFTDNADYVEDIGLAKLSERGTVLMVSLCESVMISKAQCWINGRNVWQVTHNGQEGIDDLTTSGTPPSSFAEAKAKCDEAIREERASNPQPSEHAPKQADKKSIFERLGLKAAPVSAQEMEVDFHFDIPIDTAEAIVGFRHDLEQPHRQYHELEPD